MPGRRVSGLTEADRLAAEELLEAAVLAALDAVVGQVAARIGQVQTAAGTMAFHMPGKHDQSTHGKGGGGAGGEDFEARAGKAATGDAAVAAAAYQPSSPEIRAALDDYGGEGPNSYAYINDGLRGGSAYGVTEGLTEAQQANVDGLDQAMREAPGFDTDALVYRSVSTRMFGGASPEDLASRDLVGAEWVDRGFVSTAASSWESSEISMRIIVPRGTKAVSYSTRDTDGGGLDRDEVLLDRGLRFRVVADHGVRRTSWGKPDPYLGRDIDVEVILDG